MVQRLGIAPASVTVLAQPFDMALPTVMGHLRVLESAGIVRSHKSGRTRTYQLVPEVLGEAAAWLRATSSHWERRLDQLDQMLTAELRTDEQPAADHPAAETKTTKTETTEVPKS
jgi:DNA-binding IclR family transcriptional regulator